MWRDAATNMNTFGGQSGAAHVAAQEDEVRTHTNAEMTYHGGRFRLEPGEALVVTVHEPDKPFLYWGLTLTSPWMESFDYRYTTTTLNNKKAKRSDDGSWRLVIAPTRVRAWRTGSTPGGRLEGYMLVRWVLADGPPHPSAEVVEVRSSPLVAAVRSYGAGSSSARLGTSCTSQPFPSGSLNDMKDLVVGPRSDPGPSTCTPSSKWNTSADHAARAPSWRLASSMSRTTRCKPCSVPAASSFFINEMEQPEPGGVSWTTRKSSPALWSTSTLKPTASA